MRVLPLAKDREPGKLAHNEMLSIEMRGKVGLGAGFGRIAFGAAYFGDTRAISGIYQRRKLSDDRSRYDDEHNPPYPYVNMRTYRPTYSSAGDLPENRAAFAAAVAWWQGMTPEERAVFKEEAERRRISEYNVAISRFMHYYS